MKVGTGTQIVDQAVFTTFEILGLRTSNIGYGFILVIDNVFGFSHFARSQSGMDGNCLEGDIARNENRRGIAFPFLSRRLGTVQSVVDGRARRHLLRQGNGNRLAAGEGLPTSGEIGYRHHIREFFRNRFIASAFTPRLARLVSHSENQLASFGNLLVSQIRLGQRLAVQRC